MACVESCGCWRDGGDIVKWTRCVASLNLFEEHVRARAESNRGECVPMFAGFSVWTIAFIYCCRLKAGIEGVLESSAPNVWIPSFMWMLPAWGLFFFKYVCARVCLCVVYQKIQNMYLLWSQYTFHEDRLWFGTNITL